MKNEVTDDEVRARIKNRRHGSTPIIKLPNVIWPTVPRSLELVCLCAVLLQEQVRIIRQKISDRKAPGIKAKDHAYNHLPHVKKKRVDEAHRRWVEDPDHRARLTTYAANHFKANQEHHQRKNREWIANNRDKNRKWLADWTRDKRQTDPNYRMGNRLRSRLWHALVGQGAKKASKTTDLMGCSIQECRRHLEKLFLPGMSWENMGEWHIDHIHPCARFDLTDPDQQRKCFHYTNLQPLWEEDNRRKGSKIPCASAISC